MKKTNSNHIPKNVRHMLMEQIEDIGQIAGLLRECNEECERGEEEAARMSASDALEMLALLEERFSSMTASLAKFSENAEAIYGATLRAQNTNQQTEN